jgi:hypothetical protein
MRAFAECLQQVLDWPDDVPKQNSIDGSTTGKGRNAIHDKTYLVRPTSAKRQSRQFVCLPVSSGFPNNGHRRLWMSQRCRKRKLNGIVPRRDRRIQINISTFTSLPPRSSLPTRNENASSCIRLCIARSSHLDRTKFIRNFSRIGDQCPRSIQQ